MKIVMIHGQNHEGSTCQTARQLANKVGGEIREFFLPRDFGHTQGVIHENLPQILAQLEDKKPTAVRQCLAASA